MLCIRPISIMSECDSVPKFCAVLDMWSIQVLYSITSTEILAIASDRDVSDLMIVTTIYDDESFYHDDGFCSNRQLSAASLTSSPLVYLTGRILKATSYVRRVSAY